VASVPAVLSVFLDAAVIATVVNVR
jgi:hypothetical protein